MTIPKPHWFDHTKVMVSTAPTCGIGKASGLLTRFDPLSGKRLTETDPETGEQTPVVDDRLLDDMVALRNKTNTPTLRMVDRHDIDMRVAVPSYYDRRFDSAFEEALQTDPIFDGFTSQTLGELRSEKQLFIRSGHGSAPQDLREGVIPYIKVSDLRAGMVNINPTNRVPLEFAKKMWRGNDSGLQAFDLISPERASKNIGDFCVLMPGQEQLLVTREVIVMRPGKDADFDPFYLLWALTLTIVREQWKRVVFMQTNREDVGDRFLEIRIPIAPNPERAREVSEPFRQHYQTIAKSRRAFAAYLAEERRHHFFVDGGEAAEQEVIVPSDPAPGD